MSIASAEVRARAVAAYRSGKGTQGEVAAMFGVCCRTFERWWQAYREEGRLAPHPRGHNPPSLDEAGMARLEGLLDAQPDSTLEQLRETLGVSCSVPTIHNSVKRLDWRYKKNTPRQ
jgi:transposase